MIQEPNEHNSILSMVKFRTYIIAGNPKPKIRPRFARGRVYDKQWHDKEEAIILLQAQRPVMYPLQPLQVVMTFFLEIPHSLSNRKRYELVDKPHMKKPDLDNLVKFYCDISNGILYEDDAQIYSLVARKKYALEPKTEITIMPYIRGEE